MVKRSILRRFHTDPTTTDANPLSGDGEVSTPHRGGKSRSGGDKRTRRAKRRLSGHSSKLETLEKRELLAIDLVSVSADVAQQFDLTPGAVNELTTPPRELTFRFDGNAVIDPASLSSGIIITAAGGDGSFTEGNEQVITPGFVGLGQTDRVVVARFAGDLPDDLYRVTVSGDPIGGVLDVTGDSASRTTSVLVDLELGPRVVAVVPQPISGGIGNRTQQFEQIEVFFNDDPLSNVQAGPITTADSNLPVVTPENYRLFLTEDTIETTDDSVATPQSVLYEPAENKATLTFPSGTLTTGGTFRLRIGSGEAVPAAADRGPSIQPATETADTFAAAQVAADAFTIDGGLQSVVFTGGEIRNPEQFVLPWPGAYENPGIRDNQRRDSINTRHIDTEIGINVYSYNFAELYGLDSQGQLLDNAITSAQRQRVREVLDLYEQELGVRFVETEDSGLQIVNGDLRGLQQTADVSAGDGTPRSIYRINQRDPSRGVLVLDAAENFFDGFGLSPDDRPSFFVEALRGIGNVIGIGELFELPTGTDGAVGSQDEPNSETYSSDGDDASTANPDVLGLPAPTGEADFLSRAARVIGRSVNRPESSDVDFYQFEVVRPSDQSGNGDVGEIVIETYAQRLSESSLLDSLVKLYRVDGAPGNETYTLVSQNDDAFGDDSMIRVPVQAGPAGQPVRYIVGVSSTGNDSYFGQLENSGNGGRSEGSYDLRVTFTPSVNVDAGVLSGLSDTDGSLLDGDADGVAGGNFNFWFRTTDPIVAGSRTIFVGKDGDATAANPGTLNQPIDTIEAALAIAQPGDIVRLLPSLGADGDLQTQSDNNTYEIGFGGPNDQQLADGSTLEVPRGVTVMIDAGAIIKLRDARIVVGSDSTTRDRSEAALQVLGTPEDNVILTSFNETTLGNNSNSLSVNPRAGDWSGIEFRNDVDLAEAFGTYASEGIFIDYVANADIRYGGGSVTATAPAVAPIQLAQARPTIIYNTIRDSAGPAVSADPNSFREDLFNAPRYQRRTNNLGGDEYQFTSDYDRVGPEIVGNSLIRNTINGLFVRVATPSAGQTETLTVPGRFDDTDITHVLSETLIVAGNPGGPTLLEDRVSIGGVSLSPRSGVGGEVPAGQYEYRLSFVTVDGQESLVSLPSRSVTVGVDQGVELRGLPIAPGEFAGRRLYRGVAGANDFQLVTTLNATSTTFIDTLSDLDLRGGTPRDSIITTFDANSVLLTPVAGQGVFQRGDSFNYRFTFADPFGGESQASGATTEAIALQDGAFTIDNIPQPPEGFVGTNVFRVDPVSGRYVLIAELRAGETTIVDTGVVPVDDSTFNTISLLGRVLGADADGGTKLLPRFDARLTVDPGIVVKLNAARIETSFGADFYAEGSPERPIYFTSLADDTVGAVNSFDAGNDGVTVGSPGDWGGIAIRQQSTGSLDYANVRFAGGQTTVGGGRRSSNALEIVQSDVRVTNSAFENNASGFAGNGDDPRFGLGANTAATIFIRGAQPIIVDNTITGSDATIVSGAAISINPNALTDEAVVDTGRSTGAVNRLLLNLDNQGPLISGNLIDDHRINGLEIRPEIITVDSVWDDTDITHVVIGSILSATHAYGGALRLRSSIDQSLVVKFAEDATLIARGRPLDIDDRVGGTLQVLGTDAFPVILTSLNDDSVGAGYTSDGVASTETLGVELLDVDGNPIEAAAGDWQGLQILAYANDRNVDYRYESETALQGDNNANGSPQVAQMLGTLARGELAGDENSRLGFNVRGTLATADDQDVYSFDAAGQTVVTIDIDETQTGLDTVVELVSFEGDVIARSDNSFAESTGQAELFVDESTGSGILPSDVRPIVTTITSDNVESPNPADAGMRVILPGALTQTNTFYVRVRTAAGISSGQYTLSIRLDSGNEIAGSTVRRADIRYATQGIVVTSAPTSSPLTDTAVEETRLIDPATGQNATGDLNSGDLRAVETVDTRLNANLDQAQSLGNLLTSDRGVLTVTGEIGNLNNSIPLNTGPFESLTDQRLEDVDVYKVDVFVQQLRPDVFDNENRFVTTTFDIDYADQLGRPNTRLHVYDSSGRLILTSNDSNVADDVAPTLVEGATSSLEGGSQGIRDAYIGPVELLEGTYYVAVTSVATVPEVLDQFFRPTATEPFTRLTPVNSTRTLASDSFEEAIIPPPLAETSPTTENLGLESSVDYTAERPLNDAAFDNIEGTGGVVPYNLSDIDLFVSYNVGIDGNDQASLTQFNPFTGELIRLAGDSPNRLGDIALRQDGRLYGYANSVATGQDFNLANFGRFQNISTTTGGIGATNSDDSIVFSRSNDDRNGVVDDDAVLITEALVFQPIAVPSPINSTAIANDNTSPFFLVGTRSNRGLNDEIPANLTANIFFRGAAATGEIGSGRAGSLDPMANRQYPANAPYNTSFGPASNDVEVGIIDVGQFEPNASEIPTITGLGLRLSNDDDVDAGFARVPNEELFVAVTDTGEIFRFNFNDPLTSFDGYDRVITTTDFGRIDPVPGHEPAGGIVRFTGVTFGPREVEGEAFEQILFATTNDGWLYAFELGTDPNGEPQAMLANVLHNGRAAVQLTTTRGDELTALGSGAPNGLAFSNVVENPWHVTRDRFDDPGHQIVTPYDFSRQELTIQGGRSLYFGYEVQEGNNPNNSNTIARPEGDPLGNISPGGAHGSVVSDQFDLSEYSAGDEPTLYFTYHLDSINPVAAAQEQMAFTDSFRVFGADDDGQWELLTTNNPARSLPNPDEFDNFFRSGIPVQETYQTTDAGALWRQARVDLSPFAGSENVRIRFDFDTAGAARHEIGSIELVGVAGDRIEDNSLTRLIDENDNLAVLQTIVGQDITFSTDAAGQTTVAAGDSIEISNATETFTIQYVDVLTDAQEDGSDTSGGIFNFGEGVVEIGGATQSRIELARRTAEAIPVRFGASISSNGTISVAHADRITPSANIGAGVSTPRRLQDPGTVILQTPNGIDAVDGESFTVSVGTGTTETFRFAAAADVGDPNPPTFGPNDIVFDDQVDDDTSIAAATAEAINAVFGFNAVFVSGGDVVFNVNEGSVTLSLSAGPTQIATSSIAGPVQIVTLPDGSAVRTGETLRLQGGDEIADIVFVRSGDEFTVDEGQFEIPFFEGDTPASLGQRVENRLSATLANLGVVATNDGFEVRGSNAAPVRFGDDPIATSVQRLESFESFAVPLTTNPAAADLDGQQITVFFKNQPLEQSGRTFTFVQDVAAADGTIAAADFGDNTILFDPADSAIELAERIRAELAVGRPVLSAGAGGGRVIEFAALSSIETGDTGLVSFTPVVDTSGDLNVRAVPVVVNAADSADRVAEELRVGLVNSLGFYSQLGEDLDSVVQADIGVGVFNITAGSRIRLHETELIEAGPYGASTFLPGDNFGLDTSLLLNRQNVRRAGVENNQIEGVYIDNIIVGFAERGEAVVYLNYEPGAIAQTPPNENFVLDPSFIPDSRNEALQPENPDEVIVGPYKLEIRTADPYGVPQDYDPINLVLDELSGSGRSFDTNDRLVDGAVSMVLPAGVDLVDGDRFTLDDGLQSLTFEFNSNLSLGDSRNAVTEGSIAVGFNPTDTAPEVAAAVRDAINSQRLRVSSDGSSNTGTLRIAAISGDSRTAGETTSARVELFGDDIAINLALGNGIADVDGGIIASPGRIIRVDAVEAETPFGDFTTRRIPVVDQDGRTVQYAQFQATPDLPQPTGYVTGDTLIVDGKIGDAVAKGIDNNVSADDGAILGSDPTQDTDVFRVYLRGGDAIDIDVDSLGLFRDTTVLGGPVITVFPEGVDVAFDRYGFQALSSFSGFTPTAIPGETFGSAALQFTAPVDGYYDIMVSSQFYYAGAEFLGPVADGVQDVGFGEYQLRVQPTGDAGVPLRDVLGVDYQFGRTDTNRTIDQGQLIIEQNLIRDYADAGIDAITQRSLAAASANQLVPVQGVNEGVNLDGLSVPGSPGLLRNQNTFGLITGTVLVNNLIVDSTPDDDDAMDETTGIRLTGGSQVGGESAGPNVYARIVNNTIVGDGNGVGIDVNGRAAPTIANNVLVDLADGIDVELDGGSLTEAAANVLAGVVNPLNIPQDQATIVQPDAEGLFLSNSEGRLFIPAQDSVLIDSSIGTISDREEIFNTVKQSVGIASSPILAPIFDATGNLRVDTPGQGATGTGQNVFADRGALDNADDRGPTARLTTPLDLIVTNNQTVGVGISGDADPAAAVVRLLDDTSLPFIEIELSDRGVGIDNSTVTAQGVTVRENGRPLREGVDYLFGYNRAGSTIRLTSTRGEFSRDATYEVQLGGSILDLAGNSLAATNARGQTLLTILTAGVNFDFGDAPSPYLVSAAANGPSHANPGPNSPILGTRVDVEPQGVNSPLADADDALSPINVNDFGSAAIDLTTIAGGIDLDLVSVPSVGQTVSFQLGPNRFTIEFVSDTSNAAVGNRPVSVSSADLATIRTALGSQIRSAIQDQPAGIEVFENDADANASIPETQIQLRAFDDEDGVPLGRYTTTGGDVIFAFGNPDDSGVLRDSDVQGVLVPGQTTFFVVNATVPDGQRAYLDGWIDYGRDGQFDRADRIVGSQRQDGRREVFNGENLIEILVPANLASGNGDVIGNTAARFRISSNGALPATGVATGGEVEDYIVTLLNNDLGLPRNTAPSFDPLPATLSVLEDSNRVVEILQNVRPGSRGNQVENDQQSLLPPTVSIVPGTNDDNVVVEGSLSLVEVPQTDGTLDYDLVYTPVADAFGSFDVAIIISDDQTPAETTSATVTINVTAVNDAPRLADVPLGSETGRSNPNNLNDSFEVDDASGVIRYRVNEDLASSPEAGRPNSAIYSIPFNQATGAGYNRFGVLDLFVPGPDNERSAQTVDLLGLVDADGNTAQTVTTTLGGTATVNVAAGTIDYTPPFDLNFFTNGLDSFEYVVVDRAVSGTLANPIAVTGLVEVELISVNDLPEFDLNRPVVTIAEDSELTTIENVAVNIAAGPRTAFDENNGLTADTLSFDLTIVDPMLPSGVSVPISTYFDTLELTDDGDLIVEPRENVFGSFTIAVLLQDQSSDDGPNPGGQAQFTRELTIDVTGVNDPPQRSDTQPILPPIDEDGGSFTIMRQALLDAFTPGPMAMSVNDIVSDQLDRTSERLQTLSLEDPPIDTAAGGTIVLADNNVDFVYTPPANFNGTDQLAYTVIDSDPVNPRLAFNTVDITVNAVNDAPLFNVNVPNVVIDETPTPQRIENFLTGVSPGPLPPSGTADTELDQTITTTVTFNEGTEGLFAEGPTIEINPDGTADLLFTPTQFESGSANFTVTLTDSGDGNNSSSAAFSIDIGQVDDPPRFTLVSGTLSIDEDQGTQTVDVINTFSSGAPNEDPNVRFNVRVVDPSDLDRFIIQPMFDQSDNLVFALAPDQFTTADSPIELEIVATDLGNNPSDPQIISLSVANLPDAPIANDDSATATGDAATFTTTEDEVRRIRFDQLLANDTDVDLPDDALSVQLPGGNQTATTQLGATVSIINGELRYDPTGSAQLQSLTAGGPTATDTFTYFAVDAAADDGSIRTSNAATVSITVSGLNDAPVAMGGEITRQPGGVSNIPIMVTDSDGQSDIVFDSVDITFRPSLGTVTYDATTRLFRYEANESLAGVDRFRYTIADASGARSNEATFVITTNPAPVAVGDRFIAVRGRTGQFNVAANDTDNTAVVAGSIRIESGPSQGTATLSTQSPGVISYTPAANAAGTDTLTYTILDDQGVRSAPATVTFSIRETALQNPDSATGTFVNGDFRNTDVNDDNRITPIDALLVINALRRFEANAYSSIGLSNTDEFSTDNLTFAPEQGFFYWDVDGNGLIQPLDALLVINRLRAGGANVGGESAEGESVAAAVQTAAIDTTSPAINAVRQESSVQLAAEIEAVTVGQTAAAMANQSAGFAAVRMIDAIADDDREVEDETSVLDQVLAAMAL